MTNDTTALTKLQTLWADGKRDAALALAAKWPRLGDHKTAIQRGHAARTNPDTYREMGYDVDTLVANAHRALADRYGLPM